MFNFVEHTHYYSPAVFHYSAAFGYQGNVPTFTRASVAFFAAG